MIAALILQCWAQCIAAGIFLLCIVFLVGLALLALGWVDAADTGERRP